MSVSENWKVGAILGTGAALAAGLTYLIYMYSDIGLPPKEEKTKLKNKGKSNVSSSASSLKYNVSSNSTAGPKLIEQDTDDDVNAELFRGYKQTKSGQVTTYFNRELNEVDKALLGDSTPKRLDAPEVLKQQQSLQSSPSPMSTPTAASGSGTSAWNAAGTWEERDVTQWATDRLKTLLTELKMNVEGKDSEQISISAVSGIQGDAVIAVARGKRKHIYDFSAELDWKWLNGPTCVASGSVSIHDITPSCEPEIVCRCNSPPTGTHKSILEKHVLQRNSKMNKLVTDTVKKFFSEIESKAF